MAGLHCLHTVAPQSQRNHLLAALPADELAWILPRLERVELTLRRVLQPSEQPVTAVYFPETGWISMINLLSDGGAAEVGHAGREGMAGLPLLFGVDTSSAQSMVQGAGTALRMEAAAFRDALERCPAFRSLLLRYALAFNEEVAQTAACNGRHVLEQRLARWILMAHDRSEGDEVPMTQEFLAMMLCVQRPGVTGAMGRLQQGGHIQLGRGAITITDRAGLEEAACECYRTVRRRFERLLGTVKRQNGAP
jgi:CRP-like cAMP-binding protein